MTDRGKNPEYWSQVAGGIADWHKSDALLAEQYRRVHLDLIARWADVGGSRMILKTDLFAEAVDPSRAFLWDMLQTNSNILGIDLSTAVTYEARSKAEQHAPNAVAEYINCDVRHLPFTDHSFDLIVSDSTLDHFQHKNDIVVSLSELSRVLKPGGTLIITMDNKSNVTEPLFRLWIYFGFNRFFIGKTYSMRELTLALTSVGLAVTDTTAIIHNPRFLTRKAISLLHIGNATRFNRGIGRVLTILDGLENRVVKYLTAQFIAARAVKPVD